MSAASGGVVSKQSSRAPCRARNARRSRRGVGAARSPRAALATRVAARPSARCEVTPSHHAVRACGRGLRRGRRLAQRPRAVPRRAAATPRRRASAASIARSAPPGRAATRREQRPGVHRSCHRTSCRRRRSGAGGADGAVGDRLAAPRERAAPRAPHPRRARSRLLRRQARAGRRRHRADAARLRAPRSAAARPPRSRRQGARAGPRIRRPRPRAAPRPPAARTPKPAARSSYQAPARSGRRARAGHRDALSRAASSARTSARAVRRAASTHALQPRAAQMAAAASLPPRASPAPKFSRGAGRCPAAQVATARRHDRRAICDGGRVRAPPGFGQRVARPRRRRTLDHAHVLTSSNEPWRRDRAARSAACGTRRGTFDAPVDVASACARGAASARRPCRSLGRRETRRRRADARARTAASRRRRPDCAGGR